MSILRMCCVPCCKNEKFPLVHKFPADNARAEQWRRALAIDNFIGLPMDVIRKRYYVCTRHFRDSDYKHKASRSINPTAVPSINLFTLNDPEGLSRKVPSMVRPTVPYFRQSSNESTVIEDDHLEIMLHVKDEYELKHTLEQSDENEKSSSSTYEMISFSEDDFISDPIPSMTKSTIVTISPEGKSNPTSSPTTGLTDPKRTLLKRPYSIIQSTVVASQASAIVPQRSQPASSVVARSKMIPAQPQRDQKPAQTTNTIVLKRVKMTPFTGECKEKSTSSAMTQTDQQLPSATCADKAPASEGMLSDEEHAPVPATQSTNSTKVLALLECTQENLHRLQRKLTEQGGALCLDERLLCLGGDEIDSKGDKAMAPNKVDDKSKYLTIRNAQTLETTSVSFVWLRDHCQCADCYNATTFQRTYTILDLPLDIEPSSCNINDERIDIIWKDGHQSSYELNQIFENQLGTFRKRLEERQTQLVLWDRALIRECGISNGAGSSKSASGYARVTLNELLCEDIVMQQVVRSLVTYGFAFITKVPANQQSTEIAVKRIFPIHRTLFGEMWTFSDDKMDHSDTSYTNGYLGPHTDNTYFCDAAGLQVLHCIQFNGTGAETILVDGFNAAERLRKADPDAYERLCHYPLEAEYIEEDKHHRYVAPVIRRHPCSAGGPQHAVVEQIRFNLYDRAPLRTLPADTVPQFYADYQRLAREISNDELQWKFQLAPGTVLIFDNWRLLHGRMAYTGKRVMTGCYVARTEYQSVARTMGLID